MEENQDVTENLVQAEAEETQELADQTPEVDETNGTGRDDEGGLTDTRTPTMEELMEDSTPN